MTPNEEKQVNRILNKYTIDINKAMSKHLGLLCIKCGKILKLTEVLISIDGVLPFDRCDLCGLASWKLVRISPNYFKEGESFKYLTKEEIVEILI